MNSYNEETEAGVEVPFRLRWHERGCLKRYGATSNYLCRCEQLKLIGENKRLREMVARYVTMGAILQEDINLLHCCESSHCNHYLAHD